MWGASLRKDHKVACTLAYTCTHVHACMRAYKYSPTNEAPPPKLFWGGGDRRYIARATVLL